MRLLEVLCRLALSQKRQGGLSDDLYIVGCGGSDIGYCRGLGCSPCRSPMSLPPPNRNSEGLSRQVREQED